MIMILDYAIINRSRLLYDSFRKQTGKTLIPGVFDGDQDLANAMYTAPIVILSQDTQEEPVFNYANEQAQILWEMSWDDFVKLPSRFSAEPVRAEERKAMLADAKEKGVITKYEGIRISRSGKRFFIKNATLWNVVDDDDTFYGQAATFDQWEFISLKKK